MNAGGNRSTGFSRRALLLGACLCPALAMAQTKRDQRKAQDPAVSASRSVMAGAPLSVFLTNAPAGARLAIARPNDPAQTAIVVVEPKTAVAILPTPGLVGDYELRMTVDRDGAPVVLLHQPLTTTQATATLAAPERVGRGQNLPIRGIGPNGEQDRVTLVRPDAPLDAEGLYFFPAENAETTLEAPDQPGLYELRYVLNAPVSGRVILARRPVTVE